MRCAEMCDTKKYFQIFEELKSLSPEEVQQIIIESNDKEEQDFFMLICNFLLQQKQKIAIERNKLEKF